MKPEYIKMIRVGYGLTRPQMAKIFGVTKQTFYHWEHGKYVPKRYDFIVLYKLWEFLHDDKKRERIKKILHEMKDMESVFIGGESFLDSSFAKLMLNIDGFGMGILLKEFFNE